MRGNAFIDYTQLGLPYKLYTCEILFNKAICRAQMYDTILLPSFHSDLKQAQYFLHQLDLPSSHETYSRITSCKKVLTVKQAKNFKVFSMPENMYFTPSNSLIKSVTNKSPLVVTTRRVVMASPLLSPEDANYSGFSGRRLKAKVCFFQLLTFTPIMLIMNNFIRLHKSQSWRANLLR
jgi:hypothetical protein